METLSRENLFEILLHLSGANLLNLCVINKQLTSFCDESNTYFWQLKVLQDYSNIPPKPKFVSWKRFYIELGTTSNYIKPIKITYVGRAKRTLTIGILWINNQDDKNQLLEKANRMFKTQFPKDHPDGVYALGSMESRTINDNEYPTYKELIYWRNPLDSPVLMKYTLDFYSTIYELNYYTTAFPEIDSEDMIPVE